MCPANDSPGWALASTLAHWSLSALCKSSANTEAPAGRPRDACKRTGHISPSLDICHVLANRCLARLALAKCANFWGPGEAPPGRVAPGEMSEQGPGAQG